MSKQNASRLWKEVETLTTRRGKPLTDTQREQKLEAMKSYAEGLTDPSAKKQWANFIETQVGDIKAHVTNAMSEAVDVMNANLVGTVGLAVDIMRGNVPRRPGQSCTDRLAELRVAKARTPTSTRP